MKSINQIDKELDLFAVAHKQINSYYFDDFNLVYTSGKVTHTVLTAMIYRATSAKDYDDIVLTLVVADKVFPKDLRNAKDVRSDTFRIIQNLKDVIYSSPRWNSFSSVKSSSTAQYFRNQGGDLVDGWTMDIVLRVNTERDLCAIPIEGYDMGEVIPPPCRPVTVLLNGQFYDEAESGSTINVVGSGGAPVRVHNSDDSYDENIPAGNTLLLPDVTIRALNSAAQVVASTVSPSVKDVDLQIADSTISNSDDSYSVSLPAEQNLELPDINFTDIDGTTTQQPSVKDLVCTLLSALTGEQLTALLGGLSESQLDELNYLDYTQTGQTVSYASGDDGDEQQGRLIDFFTLKNPNWFGTVERFTDTVGGQTYANNIVCDHATRRMIYRLPFGPHASWFAAQAHAIIQVLGTFSGWNQHNRLQAEGIICDGQNDTLNYSPLNIPSATYANIWLGTADPNSPIANAQRFNPINGQRNPLNKASGGVYSLLTRRFTKSDLGL